MSGHVVVTETDIFYFMSEGPGREVTFDEFLGIARITSGISTFHIIYSEDENNYEQTGDIVSELMKVLDEISPRPRRIKIIVVSQDKR